MYNIKIMSNILYNVSNKLAQKSIYLNPIVLLIGGILYLFTISHIKNSHTTQICNKNFTDSFYRQFYHSGISHLYSNLVVFAQQTANLHVILGYRKYILLLALILVLITVIEYILYTMKIINCSIGFSGVVFGIVTWSLLYNKGLNKTLIFDIILLLSSSIWDTELSFSGHLIGVISGFISYGIYKKYIL